MGVHLKLFEAKELELFPCAVATGTNFCQNPRMTAIRDISEKIKGDASEACQMAPSGERRDEFSPVISECSSDHYASDMCQGSACE